MPQLTKISHSYCSYVKQIARMPHLDRVRPRRLVRHAFPDRVHVGPVEVPRTVPTPAPHCNGYASQQQCRIEQYGYTP